jgi:hypothetical protein
MAMAIKGCDLPQIGQSYDIQTEFPPKGGGMPMPPSSPPPSPVDTVESVARRKRIFDWPKRKKKD